MEHGQILLGFLEIHEEGNMVDDRISYCCIGWKLGLVLWEFFFKGSTEDWRSQLPNCNEKENDTMLKIKIK